MPTSELELYKSCLPKFNLPLTRVLQGMACSTAEVLGDGSSGVRAIRLGNNAAFLLSKPASDTIYERQFYPKLMNVICNSDLRVILLSNPGTGKSVFQFYMLARFLNPALFAGDGGHEQKTSVVRKFGSATPPRVVVRHVLGSSIQVWFLEQQIVHKILGTPIEEVLSCFDPATTLYFFEPNKVKGVEPFADDNEFELSTLATVSPDKSRFHDFQKVASMVYMPVFTEDELVAIGRDMMTRPGFDADLEPLYSDDAIRGRFKTYNGIIRHVLPQNTAALVMVEKNSKRAIAKIDPMQFLVGDLEDQTISHYAAVYTVNKSSFLQTGLMAVNANVLKTLKKRFMEVSLADQMQMLQRYSELGYDPLGGIPSHLFENVVAQHLTSAEGVRWHTRHVNTSAVGKAAKSTTKKGTKRRRVEVESLMPLDLRLRKIVKGKLPLHSAMEPDVLYKSLSASFPFCDMVYKDKDDKIFCIQVSLGRSGKRHVSVGAFNNFCKRIGLEAADQRRLISYVYCPEPKLADKAEVEFENGIELNSSSVWHVDSNYDSGV